MTCEHRYATPETRRQSEALEQIAERAEKEAEYKATQARWDRYDRRREWWARTGPKLWWGFMGLCYGFMFGVAFAWRGGTP